MLGEGCHELSKMSPTHGSYSQEFANCRSSVEVPYSRLLSSGMEKGGTTWQKKPRNS